MLTTDIHMLERRVRATRSTVDGLFGEARSLVEQGKNLMAEIEQLKGEIDDLERVTMLLNSIGEERQMKAQGVIEGLVTRGLQTIFDDKYSFHIIQTDKGKTANVEFVVRTTLEGSTTETSVMEARGGGLAAVVGFLLRVVVMLLRSDKNEKVLFLDETFAHVSAEYLPALGEFLREIVDKSDMQIIMVTHQDEFVDYADVTYRFGLDANEHTTVKEQL